MGKKVPDEYQCQLCGWEGKAKGAHKVKYPGVTFLVCKCGGRLKERLEWREWINNKQKDGII